MIRGPLESVMAQKPHASGPEHPLPPAGVKGVFKGVENPPGDEKMWRLKTLKNSARKSRVAVSPTRRIFLPKVKSSFRPPNERAPDRDRGSLPKVNWAGKVNAAGFQNGVVAGLRVRLFTWLTPGTTLTRAIPVWLHPPNKMSPAVPSHRAYTVVGVPE